MEINLTEVNYNDEFITCLLKDVDSKIALVSDKDYKNQVYDLGLNVNISNYTSLLDIRNVLDKVLKCNNCYEELCIKDVISVAKTIINRC